MEQASFSLWNFLYLDKTIVAHLKKGVNKKLTPLTIFIIGQEAKSGYPSCRNNQKCDLLHFSYPASNVQQFTTQLRYLLQEKSYLKY